MRTISLKEYTNSLLGKGLQSIITNNIFNSIHFGHMWELVLLDIIDKMLHFYEREGITETY